MSAELHLGQRLADTDAALPPPSARGLTAAGLERLLRRRRCQAMLAAGVVLLALAPATAWLLRPRAAHAVVAAQRDALRARLDALVTRVDALCAGAGPAASSRHRAQLAIEQAAVAGAQCALGLRGLDPAAAARHHEQVVALYPDSFAARALAAAQPGPHR